MARTYGNFTDFIDFSRASSGTYLGSDGLLKTAADNEPRIEYDANGNELGLLIEEQRTNLLPYSEDFTNAAWADETIDMTLTGAYALGADGNQTASRLQYGGGGDLNDYIQDRANPSGGTASKSFTFSIWVSGSGTFRLKNTHGAVVDNFSSDITATAVLTRYDFSVTNNSSAGNGQQIVGIVPSTSFDAFDLIIWGAQLEEGSFPTSLIPTSGATATRSADIADIATANFGYNQKAGTVVVEFDTTSSSAGYIGDQTFSTSVAYSSNRDFKTFNGTSTAPTGNQFTLGEVAKGVIAYSHSGRHACLNGGTVASNTGEMQNVTTYKFGQSFGANYLNGHIKSITYRPRRNTNTQLQEFTS